MGIEENTWFVDHFAYGADGWGGVDDDYRFECKRVQRGSVITASRELNRPLILEKD